MTIRLEQFIKKPDIRQWASDPGQLAGISGVYQ